MHIESEVPISEYPIQAVADLLDRAYWGRCWCFQEFTVASKVTLLCGASVLENGDMAVQVFLSSWERFTRTLGRQPHGLNRRPFALTDLRRSYRHIKDILLTGFVDDPSLITPEIDMPDASFAYMNPGMTDTGKAWMLREARKKLTIKELLHESSKSWLETSKDHKEDQILGLVGMAVDVEELGIPIDCTISWESLYTQTTVAYRKRNDLWFLNHTQGLVEGRLWTLPPWVPDWSIGFRGSAILYHYSPPRGSHLGTLKPIGPLDIDEIERHARLRLRGLQADVVTWVSTERVPHSVNSLKTPARYDIYRWIQQITTQCATHSRRDIWQVMLANSTRLPLPEKLTKGASEGDRLRWFDNAFDHILKGVTPRDPSVQSIVECFLRCFMQATAWRCVFRTRNGGIGLAHVGIKKDDRVVVFMGNETAFVVRPVMLTGEESRYRVMCEAYVHGLMAEETAKLGCKVEDIVLE